MYISIKLARIGLHYMHCVHKLYVLYSPLRTPSGQLMSLLDAISIKVYPHTVSNIQSKGTAQLLYMCICQTSPKMKQNQITDESASYSRPPFALRMTKASSQNVGKFTKQSTENLRLCLRRQHQRMTLQYYKLTMCDFGCWIRLCHRMYNSFHDIQVAKELVECFKVSITNFTCM